GGGNNFGAQGGEIVYEEQGGYVDEDYGDGEDYGIDGESSFAESNRNSIDPPPQLPALAPTPSNAANISKAQTSPAPTYGFPEAQSATFHDGEDDFEEDDAHLQ